MCSDWSDELKKLTIKILEEIDAASFMLGNRCHMKRKGSNHLFQFGYITLTDDRPAKRCLSPKANL